jgi:hypothetical protein
MEVDSPVRSLSSTLSGRSNADKEIDPHKSDA